MITIDYVCLDYRFLYEPGSFMTSIYRPSVIFRASRHFVCTFVLVYRHTEHQLMSANEDLPCLQFINANEAWGNCLAIFNRINLIVYCIN